MLLLEEIINTCQGGFLLQFSYDDKVKILRARVRKHQEGRLFEYTFGMDAAAFERTPEPELFDDALQIELRRMKSDIIKTMG